VIILVLINPNMVAKTRRVPDKMNTCKPGKGTKMEKKFSIKQLFQDPFSLSVPFPCSCSYILSGTFLVLVTNFGLIKTEASIHYLYESARKSQGRRKMSYLSGNIKCYVISGMEKGNSMRASSHTNQVN